MFFDICLKYPAKKPIICRKTKIWGDWRTQLIQCKITTFKDRCFKFCAKFSGMKKKSNGMSPDMFRDAMSSTTIPILSTTKEGDKNDSPVILKGVPDGYIPKNEIFPINWENRTVSARALYDFLGVVERFSKWCKRYFAHGFVENVDYTPIEYFISLGRIAKRDIGDYLLTFKMAKSIAMLQRSEKGIQACNFFTRIETQGGDENNLRQQHDHLGKKLPTTHFTTENDDKLYQNELIKIDFDKQIVSARALYNFLELVERFSKWCKRMFSYGLVENVDYTAVPNGTNGVPFGTLFVPFGTNSDMGEIDDYLLTIEAAKHIAMVQRNEKGKQARQYFINVEKRYLKTLSNKEPEATSTGLLDKFLNLLVELEEAMIQQTDSKSLAEQKLALEQKLAEQAALFNLKEEYIERTISKKIDRALKTSFREADQIKFKEDLVNRLPRATNPNTVVVLNQLEKSLQKTTLEEDLIRKWYRPAERKTENAIFLTSTEITLHLETFSKKVGVRNVGIALKKLGFERLHRGINGYQTKGYYVIQLH
jgi:phage anti-repressor protein